MRDIAEVLEELDRDLVGVPAGEVVLGRSESEIDAELDSGTLPGVQRGWLLKEVPEHRVAVPAYRISRRPLTIDQVRTLAPATGVVPSLDGGTDDPATVGVANSFQLCAALSELLSMTIMLPTEEQWVRAARGDSRQRYPWGDGWRSDAANLSEAGRGATCAVGSFPSGASVFGLLDMIGHADELTRTLYHPYEGAPGELPEREPHAHAPFVTKGGGWMHGRDLARCTRRHGIYGRGEPLAVRLATPDS